MNVFHKFAIKSLKLNRTRTIVTIIGIILSTAMLTAVTTTVSSVQQFLLEVMEKQNGCWHGVVWRLVAQGCQRIGAVAVLDYSWHSRPSCTGKQVEDGG